MNKKIFGFVVLCFMLSFAFVACNNDDETPDSNSEWALFNDYYLDSIAAEAKANRLPGDLNNSKVTTIEKDKWSIKNYAVQPEEDLTFTPNKLQQVYIKWIKDYREDPQECIYPLYTDSVKISYKGKYVTGEVFDSNYSGEFNPEIAEPTTMALSGLIQGWAAALIYMPVGTRAELYIPYTMGYGVYGQGDIPGYTTLVFDLYLDGITHPAGPDDRKLKAAVSDEDKQ